MTSMGEISPAITTNLHVGSKTIMVLKATVQKAWESCQNFGFIEHDLLEHYIFLAKDDCLMNYYYSCLAFFFSFSFFIFV